MDCIKMMDVYAIPDATTSGENQWPKIGVAFVNHDHSINVVLDLFPRFGKIHIRPAATSAQKSKQGESV